MTQYIEIDEQKIVDFGLTSGTLQTAYNIGAKKPEETGLYFSWADRHPKVICRWYNYQHCEGKVDQITKYNNLTEYGTVDQKTRIEDIDNSAKSQVGADCDIPTVEQIQELIENCCWNFDCEKWVFGQRVSSLTNDNEIFLPAAGFLDGQEIQQRDNLCCYWSSEMQTLWDQRIPVREQGPHHAHYLKAGKTEVWTYEEQIMEDDDERYANIYVAPSVRAPWYGYDGAVSTTVSQSYCT